MEVSLALPRRPLSIPVLRQVLGDALRGLGVTDTCVSDLLVAVSEACTNVVRHAETDARYEVVAHVDVSYCVLEITDRGPGFLARSDGQARALAESGRGITIMRALVDDVRFDSSPGNGTVVHMAKQLAWRAEAPMVSLAERPLTTAG